MNLEATIMEFKAHLEKMKMYQSAMSVMSFDDATIAPKGATADRAKRNGFFAAELFALSTGEKMKSLLEALEPHKEELDVNTAAMYRLVKKNYDKSVKIPIDKIRAFRELTSKANDVWEKARKDNDFAAFAPYLRDIVAARKEMVEFVRTDDAPTYDYLLDDYEEGATMAMYDEYFAKVRAAIVPLLKGVMESKKKINYELVKMSVDIETQRKISEYAAKMVGYDLNRGYIGETAHPFCSTFSRNDVRITTRYDENDFLSSFYSILHECGHALYEQNTGEDIAGTVLARGVSMGIHESQSRFYENVIGRSKGFWEYATNGLKEILPQSYKDVTATEFYEAANLAGPSLIRVEADELTYSLHIMVRYEIERMLFTEDIDIMELPAIWNKKFEEYLGITPPNDAMGVLQDIHWSFGGMGYFPTYSIGSAYSAQFLSYMKREMDFDALVKKGDFATITAWLVDKIHRHGSIHTPKDLVHKIAGEQLNADYYVDYLNEKFKSLYEIQ
ncbi:MAG: carboxypeptidase M32 [Defluviitaleaceae bacterium]|nr:carboxypeptidase M32 [Defluviitaleaceae bacterium]